MLTSVLVVAQQVLMLFLVMSVGFVCRRIRFLDDKSVKGMIDLLMMVVTPCLIVHIFERPFEPSMVKGLGLAFVAALFAHAVAAAFAALCLHDRASPPRERVRRFAVLISNAGYMGIPLEMAVLGKEGAFYGIVYVVMVNLVVWTYGLYVMCGSRKGLGTRIMFVNPGTVGVVLGLPLFLFSLKLPAPLHDAVEHIANMNTPLAMISVGFFLAGARMGVILKYSRAYLAMFLRHFAVPLVVIGVLYLFRTADPMWELGIITASAAPVGAMAAMFAAKYEQDVEIGVGIVTGSTLLSIATMPLVVGFAMWLFGFSR